MIASTGADAAAALSGAIGAMSGPLHGGAPARVLPMIEEVERTGDASGLVTRILDRGERLMGFGHRVYRAEDPRARVLRRTCFELDAPRYEAAASLEHAALTVLRERRPDRAIETNVEFWAAVILDFAQVPPHMMPAMFTCGPDCGLVRAHPGAEAGGQAGAPVGAVHRPGAAHPGGGRGLGGDHATSERARLGSRGQRRPRCGRGRAARRPGRAGALRIDSDSAAPTAHSTAPPYHAAS